MSSSDSLFVDTSGWFYLVDRADPRHADVSRVYQQAIIDGRSLLTTNYVIAELVALMTTRRFPRPLLFAFIDSLLALPNLEIVHIDSSLYATAWRFLKTRVDKEWSLVDATSFLVMDSRGLREALATDQHFTQAGFVRLPLP